MARPKKCAPLPELAGKTKIELLQWLLSEATQTYLAAKAKESWVAAQAALKQIKELKVELDAELDAAGQAITSEEQFAAALSERVTDLATPHLEICVQEYLKRHPGMKLVATL